MGKNTNNKQVASGGKIWIPSTRMSNKALEFRYLLSLTIFGTGIYILYFIKNLSPFNTLVSSEATEYATTRNEPTAVTFVSDSTFFTQLIVATLLAITAITISTFVLLRNSNKMQQNMVIVITIFWIAVSVMTLIQQITDNTNLFKQDTIFNPITKDTAKGEIDIIDTKTGKSILYTSAQEAYTSDEYKMVTGTVLDNGKTLYTGTLLIQAENNKVTYLFASKEKALRTEITFKENGTTYSVKENDDKTLTLTPVNESRES